MPAITCEFGWFRLYEPGEQAGGLGVDDLVLHRGNDQDLRMDGLAAFSADP